MSFKILGMGSHAPERIVTNEELSRMVETSDEWIMKRIGVKTRHVCTVETVVDLGLAAAEKALSNAGIKPEELDLIIGTTCTPENISPGLACMVQNRLGAACPAMDVVTACTGFLFGIETAAGFFARRAVKKVLVVSAERMSGVLDWTDRSTCCIFGDGAGAAVLGEGDGYLLSSFTTQGNEEILRVPVKSDKSPFYERRVEEAAVQMKGQETYRFAVTSMVENIRDIMEKSGISGSEISAVIPHQANARIISEAARRLPEIDSSKFFTNIAQYGNTSSASVPILLAEVCAQGKIKDGDYVILAAFGGGLSSGACIIKW